MAQIRRFHGPGQGGRTGLRIDNEIDTLSGYFEAGRKAIRSANTHDDDDDDDDDDGESDRSNDDDDDDDDDDDAGDAREASPSSSRILPGRASVRGRQSGLGSSSMDIENSEYYDRAMTPSPSRASRGRLTVQPAPGYAPSPTRTSATPRTNGRSSLYDESIGGGGGGSFDNFSTGLVDQENSLIDHGDDQYDHDRGVGPSARPSLAPSTPGVGRQRMSDFSPSRIGIDTPQRSARKSLLLDTTQHDNDQSIPMSFGGNHDDEYPELDVSGLASRRGHDEEELVYEEDVGAEALQDTTAGAEEVQEARKRGRPPKKKQKIQVDRATTNGSARRLPTDLVGNRIIERIASSRGRAGTVMDGDVRRSTRHRIAPLDWWRGERAVYGRPGSRSRARRSEGDGADPNDTQDPDDTIPPDEFEEAPRKGYAVPVLKSVIRVARAPGEGTFSGMRMPKRAKGAANRGQNKVKGRKRSKRGGADDGEEVEIELDPTAPSRHAEDGWDEATGTEGVVWDAERQEEVTQKIACPRSQIRIKQATDSSFAFEKVFGVDHYMAAGILEIPVDGEKPLKPTKDNNYVFAVIEGAVDVQIYRSVYRLGPGGMFAVPKGNMYAMHNISRRTAKVFFAQSRQRQQGGSGSVGDSASSGGGGSTARPTPAPAADDSTVSVPATASAQDETVDTSQQSVDDTTSRPRARAPNGKEKTARRQQKNKNDAPAADDSQLNADGDGTFDESTSSATTTKKRTSTSTGRPRGRPKGSGNKNKQQQQQRKDAAVAGAVDA